MNGLASKLRSAWVLLAVPVVLTACTPEPVDLESSGPLVTVHITDVAGVPVNGMGAIQTVPGLWRSIAPTQPGRYAFYVPEEGARYGFALACPTGLQGSAKKVQVFHLTADEATELQVTCPATFEASATTVAGMFDATAVGADRLDVYTSIDFELGPVATPVGAYGPVAIPAGSPQSLVAVARDAGFGLLGVRVIRNVSAAAPTNQNISFEPGDFVGIVPTEDWTSSVPSGFSANASVGLVVEGSQLVPLASTSTANASSLPTVSGMEPGDLYRVQSAAQASGPPTVIYTTQQFQPALDGLDLDLPAPWATPPDIVPADLPTFTGLTPLPNEPDHRGHVLAVAWPGLANVPTGPASIDGLLQVFVSEAWLGTDTTFTMPDLSSVPGFAGARPLSGDDALWISAAFSSNLETATLVEGPALPQAYASGALFPLFPHPVAGAVQRTGRVQGLFTVP